MTGVDVIRTALQSTQQLLNWFLGDLADADLLVRPTPGANHIAWQMGHLIRSEIGLVKEQLPDAVFPPMPEGFDKQHGKETQAAEPPAGFLPKARYLELFNSVRQATIAAVGKLSDADLDRPTAGTMARIAPDRRWFGNTRVIGQEALQKFREEMKAKLNDPYSVIIKSSKLPLSLLH